MAPPNTPEDDFNDFSDFIDPDPQQESNTPNVPTNSPDIPDTTNVPNVPTLQHDIAWALKKCHELYKWAATQKDPVFNLNDTPNVTYYHLKQKALFNMAKTVIERLDTLLHGPLGWYPALAAYIRTEKAISDIPTVEQQQQLLKDLEFVENFNHSIYRFIDDMKQPQPQLDTMPHGFEDSIFVLNFVKKEFKKINLDNLNSVAIQEFASSYSALRQTLTKFQDDYLDFDQFWQFVGPNVANVMRSNVRAIKYLRSNLEYLFGGDEEIQANDITNSISQQVFLSLLTKRRGGFYKIGLPKRFFETIALDESISLDNIAQRMQAFMKKKAMEIWQELEAKMDHVAKEANTNDTYGVKATLPEKYPLNYDDLIEATKAFEKEGSQETYETVKNALIPFRKHLVWERLHNRSSSLPLRNPSKAFENLAELHSVEWLQPFMKRCGELAEKTNLKNYKNIENLDSTNNELLNDITRFVYDILGKNEQDAEKTSLPGKMRVKISDQFYSQMVKSYLIKEKDEFENEATREQSIVRQHRLADTIVSSLIAIANTPSSIRENIPHNSDMMISSVLSHWSLLNLSPEKKIKIAEQMFDVIHAYEGYPTQETIWYMLDHPDSNRYSDSALVQRVFNCSLKLGKLFQEKKFETNYNAALQRNLVTKDQYNAALEVYNILADRQRLDFRDPKSTFRKLRNAETFLSTLSEVDGITQYIDKSEPKVPELFEANYEFETPNKTHIRLRVLPAKDPQHFSVGVETECCQYLGGVGEDATIDGFVNPLASVLVVEHSKDNENTEPDDRHWNLLYQSYFHWLPKEQTFILDNIEANPNYTGNVENMTGVKPEVIYSLWAKHMKNKFPNMPYLGLGKAYTKIPVNRFKPMKLEEDPRSFSDKIEEPYSDFNHKDFINLLQEDSNIVESDALGEGNLRRKDYNTDAARKQETQPIIRNLKEQVSHYGNEKFNMDAIIGPTNMIKNWLRRQAKTMGNEKALDEDVSIYDFSFEELETIVFGKKKKKATKLQRLLKAAKYLRSFF